MHQYFRGHWVPLTAVAMDTLQEIANIKNKLYDLSHVAIILYYEKSEGIQMDFLTSQFHDTIPDLEVSIMFMTERAHSTPLTTNSWSSPRALIANILYFQAKVVILKVAHLKRELQITGNYEAICPDSSTVVQKWRTTCTEVKKWLHDKGFQVNHDLPSMVAPLAFDLPYPIVTFCLDGLIQIG